MTIPCWKLLRFAFNMRLVLNDGLNMGRIQGNARINTVTPIILPTIAPNACTAMWMIVDKGWEAIHKKNAITAIAQINCE